MENQFENIADQITAYLPNILGALVVLLVGWLVAKGIRALINKLFEKTNWDERVLGKANIQNTNKFVGNLVYYVLMIIVILIVLEILGVHQVLDPLKNMVNEFLSFIPNLIAAILIGVVGYMLAKFVSKLVNIGGGILDTIVDRTSFKDTNKIVNVIQKVVFIVIFVPFLIQAFNALQMEAISEPANAILYDFTEMLGQIFVAAAIIIVFVWGGKYLASFLKELFASMQLDRFGERINIHNMIGANQSLSGLLANILYFFLVFFGIITAVEILGMDRLTDILNEILEITGQILFGLVILALGNYISTIIYDTMTKSQNNKFIASIVRVASMALFIAIALRTMGIANEIVELAFGLILGAIAVAVALSYGLGGREAAGEHFKHIIGKLRSNAPSAPSTPSEPTPKLPRPDSDNPNFRDPNNRL